MPFSHSGMRSFHVTLIRPPAVWPAASLNVSSLAPPLGVAYLAAFLRREGFSLTVIDAIGEAIGQVSRRSANPRMAVRGMTVQAILEGIPSHTNLIGVSAMFSVEWPNTRDLITKIRGRFPRVPLVIGGEHATALADFCLENCPAVDYVILGEGEEVLVELAMRLSRGALNGPPIAGLLSRGGRGMPACEDDVPPKGCLGRSRRRIYDLDSLPWPAWDLVPLENYLRARLSIGKYVGVTMPILASRGCPFDCAFCSNSVMWGRLYKARSPRDVVDEIAFYRDRYRVDVVEFHDLTPVVQKEWLLNFCEEILTRKLGIRWQISGGTRCEAFDEDALRKAKQAGCMYLGFVPESGDPAVLRRIGKNLNLHRMLKLIRTALRLGIDTRCNFVIGFPDDTRFQIWRTLLLQFRLALLGVVDAPIFDFTPYPGSRFFRELRASGVIRRLDDEFFESLGLNVQLTAKRGYCRHVGPLELSMYRLLGMTVFYAMYYLTHPRKFYAFLKNFWDYRESQSVFEQRLIQNLHTILGMAPPPIDHA